MASVIVENVSVEFPLYQGNSRSLKKSLIHMGAGGRLAHDAADRICVQALKEVSLHLKHGDRLGVVGPNGAGKTTLLRVLAGVYEPVRGQVWVEGKVSPLFDVNLGIDPEATGEENIVLRGLYLGLSKREIEARAEEIAEFTELGDYLRMPARTYSAGMMLRLAFAVSTCIEPDILLMDEWILAGDTQFLNKAQRRMETFVERSNILVIASHSQEIMRQWGNKAMLLDRGEVMATGSVEEVLGAYQGFAPRAVA